MKDIEYILDFTAQLGSRMIVSGGSLERANDSMTRICMSYGLTDISIFSLSSMIIISARMPGGADTGQSSGESADKTPGADQTPGTDQTPGENMEHRPAAATEHLSGAAIEHQSGEGMADQSKSDKIRPLREDNAQPSPADAESLMAPGTRQTSGSAFKHTESDIEKENAGSIYASRQIDVPARSLHMERLNQLNRLSRKVCRLKPDPTELMDMLEEAEMSYEDYPLWQLLIGRMIAMTSLCVLFGGGPGDIIASDLIILALCFIIDRCSRLNLNHIIMNTACMFFAGTAALLLVHVGLGRQYFIIVVTCCMMLIPGIPLVNAARNLLCGNEMNGILEASKAVIEALAIVLGIILSLLVFGQMLQ